MENPYPTDAIRTQLDEARKRIEELEAEVREAQVLKSQLKQVERSSQTQAELRQSSVRWHTKFQEERSAREQAERQARDYRNQASQWQKAYQVVSSKLEATTREATNLRGDLQKLEPLKVWAGHPCTVCGKPLTGSVSPKLAAKLQKGLGHKSCLEERGSGMGKMLLAVSTAW
jgi:DNA repair exonuclease SbcCD ATPase subunit